MGGPADHISLKCPNCGKTNVFHRTDIRKDDGTYAQNVRNPHWEPDIERRSKGSFWRDCAEALVHCEFCGDGFHVDCD